MLLHIVFTSLLINSLCFLSEGINRIELNQTSAFLSIKSDLVVIKSDQGLIKADQQVMRSDLGILRSDQQQIKADQQQMKSDQQQIKSDQQQIKTEISSDKGLIQEEVTLLKSSQSRIESMLNVLIEKVKLISDMKKEELPTKPKPPNCAEAISTFKYSGIYEILIPSYSEQPFKVACDAETHGGKWTIILRRKDGSENFYRNWTEYKEGFGNLTGEFFLGLDKIHALTNDQPQELLVLLEDFEGQTRYEAYDAFGIGAESELYKLHTVGNATGTGGDSLRYHLGMSFTSYDRDNDDESRNCAVVYTGGWWHKSCHWSHLMGVYKDNSYGKGVSWGTFRGPSYALKRAVMMIRPRKI